MKTNMIRKLVPSALDVGVIALIVFIILLLGDGRILLERLGIINSTEVVKAQLGNGLSSGFGKLDSLTATQTAVSFVVWALAGLVAFSIVQAMLRYSAKLRYERQLSSANYIHPTGFTSKSYWQKILLDSAVSFLLLALLLGTAIAFIFVIAPIGLAHTRHLLLRFTPSNVRDLLVGLLLLAGGSYIVFVISKITLLHHRKTIS